MVNVESVTHLAIFKVGEKVFQEGFLVGVRNAIHVVVVVNALLFMVKAILKPNCCNPIFA